MRPSRRRFSAALAAGAALAGPLFARAETLSGPALANALRRGGYVLVMRHTRSPEAPPAPGAASPDNPGSERELDEEGKASATAIGAAIRRLRIPIGEVISSPTFRARQTVRLAGLTLARTAPELGDGGQSMSAAGAAQTAGLKAEVGRAPPSGSNRLLVTHFPNIRAAFGEAVGAVADGEILVFRPASSGTAELVGRVVPRDWAALGEAQ